MILPIIHKWYSSLLSHRYGLSLAIYLGAATVTGAACVLFMKGFEFVYEHRIDPQHVGLWCLLTTPLLFLMAVLLIRKIAPCADGSGIPQVIYGAQHLDTTTFKRIGPLVSFKTMAIKIISLLIGVWAGASTGREGPTVHVAACLFFAIAMILHKFFKLHFDMRSALIAGGAAGLAAAFNTPLAGVTFAIEELSSNYFSNIKDMVLVAIIVGGLAAKTLTGEYIYFGKLSEPVPVSIFIVITVAIIAGLSGILFSEFLIEGRRRIAAMSGWRMYLAVSILAWGVLFLVVLSGVNGIMGPGNLVAQNYVHGGAAVSPLSFAISKMLATLFTYWSGIAGGIFGPSLSMGSAIGAWVASWQNAPIPVCAVIGMVAFLSGAIQAPITSFVIIYEMTGHHQTLLPLMLAALVGYMIARLLKARHLYQELAGFYDNKASSHAK